MAPPCSYLPANQTQRLLADLPPSTHTLTQGLLQLAQTSQQSAPRSRHTYWLVQLDVCYCLTDTHRSLQQLAHRPVVSPVSPRLLELLASLSALKSASFSYTNAHTQSREHIHTEKYPLNLPATCLDVIGPFYSPFSLFSHACSLQIHHFSAHASSQRNSLPQITFSAFIPDLLHPHPNLVFLKDWRDDYRFVYVNVL